MLATRISFMNMIANLCSAVGADVDEVRKGIGTDSRIGSAFLFAGCGYGGSCFPKDVQALIRTLNSYQINAEILEATERVNKQQTQQMLERVFKRFGQDLSGRTFGVWGLSFKPETDDMRDAPALVVVNGLLAAGAKVRVHDPEAMEVARTHFGAAVEYCDNNYDVLPGADALIILTEWKPYRRPDFERMRGQLAHAVIIDGRNLFDPEKMREHGFEYISIGRPSVDELIPA
jgi:UDPglucose 6-dehydrogenase